LGDAILDNDLNEVKKAGRFAIAYCFYAKIGSETSDFDMADVCNEICDKLIHRHPHIYSDVVVKDEESETNWEKLS
jgi:XTP/dITP diphosphohydrolase